MIVGGETGDVGSVGSTVRSVRSFSHPSFSQSLGMLTSKENTADLDALRELIETGAVTPAVDRTYGISETASAIQDVQDGLVRGKAVITI